MLKIWLHSERCCARPLLHQCAVTMFEFLARAARTRGVAADLSPSRRIVGIDRFGGFAQAHALGRERRWRAELVFPGERIDMVGFHSGKLPLLHRWRLAHANLHMHEYAYHVGVEAYEQTLE